MKKVLLFSIFFLSITLGALAYETVIIHFPDGELWEKAYYKKIANEALLQYVPFGQSSNDWNRSIVVHSYNQIGYPLRAFSYNNLLKMKKANPTAEYRTLRLTDNDAIFTRCTNDYKTIKGQCEFFRVTHAHDGFITIHYMNKNKKDFMNNYTIWYEIIKTAKYYNSYYRDERTFDKSLYFEL